MLFDRKEEKGPALAKTNAEPLGQASVSGNRKIPELVFLILQQDLIYRILSGIGIIGHQQRRNNSAFQMAQRKTPSGTTTGAPAGPFLRLSDFHFKINPKSLKPVAAFSFDGFSAEPGGPGQDGIHIPAGEGQVFDAAAVGL